MVELVTAGESFDDLLFYGLRRMPAAGQELRTDAFARSPGGGVMITAIAASRLGIRCAVLSALSPDCERLLRRERVVVHNLRAAREPAAVTIALSTAADRRFITFNGVNGQLPKRIHATIPRIRARHVHFAFVPKPCRPWVAAVERLRRLGITTSWDFGWDERLPRDADFRRLAGAVDYLFLNRVEMLMYSGRRNARRALDCWRAAARHVIIKLGAAGSGIVGGGVEIRSPGRRVRAVDSTGAGDAFNGGFLAARLRGRTLRQALALGNRIGAQSTRRPGGIAGLPARRALS